MKHIEVVAAVITNDNKYLCALRSQNMSQPGVWEFPGGKVEQSENHVDTLIREIREELNCLIIVKNKITHTLHSYGTVSVNLHTYYAEIVSGIPEAKEHERLIWLPKEMLMELDWAPADIPTVQILLERF